MTFDTAAGRRFSAADADASASEGVTSWRDQVSGKTRYGAIQWGLVDSRLLRQNERDRYSRSVVIVETLVTNLSDVRARARDSDLVLLLDDGRSTPLDRFAHTPSTTGISLDPGQSILATLVFKPYLGIDTDLEDLSIQIEEPNRHPATLSLDAAENSSPYPVRLPIVPTTASTDDSGFVIEAAEVNINTGSYRAAIDERLVIVRVRPTSSEVVKPDADGPGWDEVDYWTLTIDGQPTDLELSPNRIRTYGGLSSDRRITPGAELAFVVPENAFPGVITLSGGNPSLTVGQIAAGPVENAVNEAAPSLSIDK